MKNQRIVIFILLAALLVNSCNEIKQKNESFNSDKMIIRISEIEIDSVFLNEYISILKEESEASVRLEPGVISIFPMFRKETPTEISILEIYAGKEAYESHLQTPHFKHYKTTTLKMVKSLKLIDMKAIDEKSMPEIFIKLNKATR